MFPAPYNTRGIRLTNAGQVHPVGMSYWPNINSHSGWPSLFVLLSINGRLTVLEVDKRTFEVAVLTVLPVTGTGEGCYWSFSHPAILYVPSGKRLMFYDVTTGQSGDAVASYDDMRQFHSSADGQVHSFTLNGHAAVSINGDIIPFPSPYGWYDECQITKSGRYLLIKETGPDGKPANRIIDLQTRREWTITDAQGALGHSDCGWDYAIGEEDRTHPGGVFRLWLYTPDGPVDKGVQYSTDWTSMSRYISHCNAQKGRPEDQTVLFSSSHDGDAPRSDEIVTARLDGSQNCRVLCPNLTDLNAGGGDLYWRKTRANIDPAEEFACFTGNMGTDRMDCFLVQL